MIEALEESKDEEIPQFEKKELAKDNSSELDNYYTFNGKKPAASSPEKEAE